MSSNPQKTLQKIRRARLQIYSSLIKLAQDKSVSEKVKPQSIVQPPKSTSTQPQKKSEPGFFENIKNKFMQFVDSSPEKAQEEAEKEIEKQNLSEEDKKKAKEQLDKLTDQLGQSTTKVAGNTTLWHLAEKYYGDPTQWTKIYHANKKLIGADPNNIRTAMGQDLIIPSKDDPLPREHGTYWNVASRNFQRDYVQAPVRNPRLWVPSFKDYITQYSGAVGTAAQYGTLPEPSQPASVKNLDEMLEYASKWIGTPYVTGGESSRGIDCSGFAQKVLGPAGVDPKGDQTAEGLWGYFRRTGQELATPKKGAVIFYEPFRKPRAGHYQYGRRITHIAIAIDGNTIIDSAVGGGGGVKYRNWRRNNFKHYIYMPNYPFLKEEAAPVAEALTEEKPVDLT